MIGMNGVLRPTDAPSSSFSEQSLQGQKPGKLLHYLLLPLLFITFSCPLFSQKVDDKTIEQIVQYGGTLGIPGELVLRLIHEESRGYADAVSPLTSEGYSSKGLLQIYDRPSNINYLLSKYWKEPYEFDVFNPLHNATLGLQYLAALRRAYGSWIRALWFYNCGRLEDVPEHTQVYALRIVGGIE